jgi:hypothetical protein
MHQGHFTDDYVREENRKIVSKLNSMSLPAFVVERQRITRSDGKFVCITSWIAPCKRLSSQIQDINSSVEEMSGTLYKTMTGNVQKINWITDAQEKVTIKVLRDMRLVVCIHYREDNVPHPLILESGGGGDDVGDNADDDSRRREGDEGTVARAKRWLVKITSPVRKNKHRFGFLRDERLKHSFFMTLIICTSFFLTFTSLMCLNPEKYGFVRSYQPAWITNQVDQLGVCVML